MCRHAASKVCLRSLEVVNAATGVAIGAPVSDCVAVDETAEEAKQLLDVQR